ncbi:MAG: protein kinase [Lachnospiraceae bacterium]|nr:protein kinase [Lachnospiraceae bacterium]
MNLNLCVNCMSDMGEASICPKCGYDEHTSTQSGSFIKRRTILNGRYIVGNAMGQGGFGITYIGFDMLLNTKVAIKEYFPMGSSVRNNDVTGNTVQWTTSEFAEFDWKAGCEKFITEAQKMAKLNSVAGIVSVHDTFYENETSYIVMDYVEGVTLKKYLLNNGLISHEKIVSLFSPLLKSLAKAHKNGLIHRDISPDNIMINEDGELMLLDLGAAKDLNINNNEVSMPVMKMGFSPAEQYITKGDIGPWTDVYAMCATIYYCLYGKVPPDSMERLMSDELAFPATAFGKLPDNIISTLQNGLACRKEDRIQTMSELLDGFEGKIKFEKKQSVQGINNMQPVANAVQPTVPSMNYNMQPVNNVIQPTVPAMNYNMQPMNNAIQPTVPAMSYSRPPVNNAVQQTAPSMNYNMQPVNNAVRPAVPAMNNMQSGYGAPQGYPTTKGGKKKGLIIGIAIAVIVLIICFASGVFSGRNGKYVCDDYTSEGLYMTLEVHGSDFTLTVTESGETSTSKGTIKFSGDDVTLSAAGETLSGTYNKSNKTITIEGLTFKKE